LPLLPRHRSLKSPHVRLGERQRERRAQSKVDVDAGFLEKALRQLAVQPHPILGDVGQRAGNSETAQRAQTAVREAGRVTANRVPLDHDTPHAGLGEVVRGRHAGDAAAHDHDVGRSLSHRPAIMAQHQRPRGSRGRRRRQVVDSSAIR
jgi:hypothetical protein